MTLTEEQKPARARARRAEPEPNGRRQADRALGALRVDLLPPIVESRRKQNGIVRLLMLGLVGLALIAAVAGFAVSLLAGAAESALEKEQARSQALLTEQGLYTEVSTVKGQLLSYDDAQLAALYAEADWPRMMRELDAALPPGVTLSSEAITVKGVGGEGVDVPIESVGLDAPGVIEVSFTANGPQFISNSALLNGLAAMTGYVSATVSTVADSGEGYTITGVVQLDTRALGGTARSAALDPEALALLREELQTSVTAPPAPPAPAAPADTTEGSAGAAADAGSGE